MMNIDGEERNGTEVTPYGLQQICGVAFGELLVSIPVLRRSAVAFFYSRNFFRRSRWRWSQSAAISSEQKELASRRTFSCLRIGAGPSSLRAAGRSRFRHHRSS